MKKVYDGYTKRKNSKEITRNFRKQLYHVGMQECQNCKLRQQTKVWENTKNLTQKKKIKNMKRRNEINCTTKKFRIQEVSSDIDLDNEIESMSRRANTKREIS